MAQPTHYDTCTDPLCVRCEAYGDGYTAGKDKSYFEIEARIAEGLEAHATLCGCRPCVVIRAVQSAK